MFCETWTDAPYTFNLNFYSEFLKANDYFIGRVIIRNKSLAQFNKIKTRTVNELAWYGISKDKLEFGFIKDEWSDIETGMFLQKRSSRIRLNNNIWRQACDISIRSV